MLLLCCEYDGAAPGNCVWSLGDETTECCRLLVVGNPCCTSKGCCAVGWLGGCGGGDCCMLLLAYMILLVICFSAEYVGVSAVDAAFSEALSLPA